ncbi:MAG: hypothetical protein JJ847_05500 [Prochlorococcus marinus CUG1438]|nr:hypothetical protein [Prochlorococcus marinus CUG1438]
MQDQRIEKLVAVVVNIIKVLVIIYLGFVEVFEIIKSLRKLLDAQLDIPRRWASQNYSILKKRLAEQKIAGV